MIENQMLDTNSGRVSLDSTRFEKPGSGWVRCRYDHQGKQLSCLSQSHRGIQSRTFCPLSTRTFASHLTCERSCYASPMTLDFPSLSPSMGRISSRPLLISKVSSMFTRHHIEKLIRYLTIFISSGFPVGIIANQLSVLNPTEAAKGAQFIRTCNQQYV